MEHERKSDGEGSRSAAGRYDQGTETCIESGASDRAAKEAPQDMADPKKRSEMEQAERPGRLPARAEDRLFREPLWARRAGGSSR